VSVPLQVLALLAYPVLVYLGVRLLLGSSYRDYRRRRREEVGALFRDLLARAPRRDPEAERAESERVRAEVVRRVAGGRCEP
jgi:hypothetical protein